MLYRALQIKYTSRPGTFKKHTTEFFVNIIFIRARGMLNRVKHRIHFAELFVFLGDLPRRAKWFHEVSKPLTIFLFLFFFCNCVYIAQVYGDLINGFKTLA